MTPTSQLHVTERGSGAPVLLIHGAAIDSDSWGPVADDLARDHRVVAYDRRGSSRSRDAGIAADFHVHAEDARAILSECCHGPVEVVGWSIGGTVALTLAAEHPELVRSLVVVEAPLHGIRYKDRHLLRAFARLHVLWRLGRRDAAVDAWASFITSRRSGGSSWTSPDYPDARRAAYRANAETMVRETRAKDDHLTAERLASLRVPVTWLVGDESPEFLHRCARAGVAAIPGAELVTVPGMNHAISLSAPEAAAAAIRDGLRP